MMELENRRTSRAPSFPKSLKPEPVVSRFSQVRRSLDAQLSQTDSNQRLTIENIAVGLLCAQRRRSRRATLFASDGTGRGLRHSQSFPQQLSREALRAAEAENLDRRSAQARRAAMQRQRLKKLLKKLKLVVRLVIVCRRLAKAHILRNKVYDELTPFISGLHFHDFEPQKELLLFDPSQFKADRQLRIGEEVKKVLSIPPQARMEKELHFTQVALRNNAAFAQYPVRMQRKIVEVGSYEKFDAKRVIVRQGHPANAFYFILSGSVVVMVTDSETKITKPVAYMYKGMTFGELAIINRTIRQATIVAKETIELLSIDIEDFHKIFMSGGVKNINDPDHDQFIQNLDFLRGWPVGIMPEHPKKCIFHYFRRGDTLVKDSHYSDWIYIIKSGSIRVMKKLRRVEALLTQHRRRQAEEERKARAKLRNEKQTQELIDLRDKQRRYILPDLHIPLAPPDDTIDDRFIFKSRLRPLIKLNSGKEINIDSAGSDSEVDSREEAAGTRESGKETEDRPKSHRDVETRKSNSIQAGERMIVTAGEGNVRRRTVKRFGGRVSRRMRKNKRRTPAQDRESEMEKEVEEEMAGRKQHIRTIAEDFDAKFREKNPEDITEADLDPQFVHIQTLTKGQVFGVSEAILGKQPSFCVVSNGAECIMIDKAFYLQHAPEALIQRLRQTCCPYPSDEVMQEGLQTSVDWNAYKQMAFANVMKQIQAKKHDLKNKIW